MKTLLSLAALAALVSLGAPASAQQYRVLVGYPPGGVQDQEARVFAERLREATGHAFIVETRAGASGQLAVEALLAAPADGTTLLMTADSNISVYPHIVKKRTFAPGDFAGVAHGGEYRISLAVANSVPANDLKSFVEWTKTQPGPVGYGTAGAGTNLHFQGVLIAQATGARLIHVPYKGTGPAIVDLAGGHVPAGVLPLGSLLPHVKAGKLKVLAQTGDKRSAALSDVPSFRELGYPTLSFSGWYGLLAKAGTPNDLVHKYNDIVVRALRTPELAARMRDWQLEPRELTPEQFQQLIREDTDRWAPVIRSTGFTAGSD